MKIFIKEIINKADKIIINCTSQFGQYEVEWSGDFPLANQWYNIELEIEEVLKWGQNIKYYNDDHYAIQGDDKCLIIIGKLESIDTDGYTVLRLNEELIPLMTEGMSYTVGSTVQVIVSSAIVFPVNY